MEKTFQVYFRDPGKVSMSVWINEYLRPAVINLIWYRKDNKAIPISNFRFYKQFKMDEDEPYILIIISQRVKVAEILIPEREINLNEN